MNLREFRSALQFLEEEMTMCHLNLNLTNTVTQSTSASWAERFLIGDNLERIAEGIMYNTYLLMNRSMSVECYIVAKTHQTWENDEEKIESIIQFDVYRDTRHRNDRPWNKRGTNGLVEMNRFVAASQSIASYAIRVRGLAPKLTVPVVSSVSGGYNSMDYPSVRVRDPRVTESNAINKEGSIGAVYQSMHYLVQVVTSPFDEELSLTFSHSSILLKEENYTDWIPEQFSEGALTLPGNCIVCLIEGEAPKNIVGDTLIEMIDNCRLNISAPSQLHIGGSNYKLNRGVYFLKPGDSDLGDLRAYERWLIQFSDTIEFTQIRNKASYLKKIDDVTGDGAQKSSKSLNAFDSIEDDVIPTMGSGRITKM